MKDTLVFFLLIFSLLFVSCEEEVDENAVIARFVAIGENSFAPTTIEFQEDNTNGQEFEWTFHDGTVYTVRNINKTYNEGGTYPVKLMVKRLENIDSVTVDITIKPKPTKIFIKEVRLIEVPISDNGTPWDAGGSPDIYVRMQGQGATLKTETRDNTPISSLPIKWTFNEPYPVFPFNSLSNEYACYVYDEDANMNQLMGAAGFRANEFTNPYRNTILLDNLNGTKLELSVEWGN